MFDNDPTVTVQKLPAQQNLLGSCTMLSTASGSQLGSGLQMLRPGHVEKAEQLKDLFVKAEGCQQ